MSLSLPGGLVRAETKPVLRTSLSSVIDSDNHNASQIGFERAGLRALCFFQFALLLIKDTEQSDFGAISNLPDESPVEDTSHGDRRLFLSTYPIVYQIRSALANIKPQESGIPFAKAPEFRKPCFWQHAGALFRMFREDAGCLRVCKSAWLSGFCDPEAPAHFVNPLRHPADESQNCVEVCAELSESINQHLGYVPPTFVRCCEL
jgi:hypothetical protein